MKVAKNTTLYQNLQIDHIAITPAFDRLHSQKIDIQSKPGRSFKVHSIKTLRKFDFESKPGKPLKFNNIRVMIVPIICHTQSNQVEQFHSIITSTVQKRVASTSLVRPLQYHSIIRSITLPKNVISN